MWWSLLSQPTAGHPNERSRYGDSDTEYGQPTNSTRQDFGCEDHGHSNESDGQTHTGCSVKQTYKNAIPEATGSVSPENRDANRYQKTEPENEREHNVQHGKR